MYYFDLFFKFIPGAWFPSTDKYYLEAHKTAVIFSSNYGLGDVQGNGVQEVERRGLRNVALNYSGLPSNTLFRHKLIDNSTV